MRRADRVSASSKKIRRLLERCPTKGEILISFVWLAFYLAMFVTVVTAPHIAVGLLAMER
jgi:hypothetical protein